MSLSKKDIFSKVYDHLLSQMVKSQDPVSGACLYLSPDGCKCAVGGLLLPGTKTEAFEGRSVMAVLPGFNGRVEDKDSALTAALAAADIDISDKETVSLLRALQRVHDDHTPERWKDLLTGIALAHSFV